MKTKVRRTIMFAFFSIFFLFVNGVLACDSCPPPPCPDCPPDTSVPLDGGLTLILFGAAALGVKKVTSLKEVKL